jgi:hypothetical protein
MEEIKKKSIYIYSNKKFKDQIWYNQQIIWHFKILKQGYSNYVEEMQVNNHINYNYPKYFMLISQTNTS